MFPSLIQVHTPHTPQPWYIARARNYNGFVVQQRYRGTGEPYYSFGGNNRLLEDYTRFEAYLQPFLNLVAVRTAGLSQSSILRWSAAHPGKIFTHPVYASLCLRWGENAHGYRVEKLPEPHLQPDAIPFTPHTCWKTATTYYQLAWTDEQLVNGAAIFDALTTQAGLAKHERQLGQEGNWEGWSSTNRPLLEQVLASQGKSFVLAQPSIEYRVRLEIPGGESKWLGRYATLDDAWMHYAQLPAVSPNEEGANYKIAVDSAISWPGSPALWVAEGEEKWVASLPSAHTLPMAAVALPACRQTSGYYLAAFERPMPTPILTLADVLARTGLTRQNMAADLGWTKEQLASYEQNPASLTLTQLSRIAHLAAMPLPRLVALLERELRARAGVRG